MRQNIQDDDAGLANLAGFGGYSFRDGESLRHLKLFLPSRTLQELHDEQRAAELARRKEQDELDRLQSQKDDSDRTSTFSKPRASLSSELDLARESSDLSAAAADAQAALESGEFVAAYSVLEPLKLIQDLKTRTPDKEIHKRNEALYRQIKPQGHLRAIARPKVDLQDFARLRRCFPHFAPVLDLVRDQFTFAELTRKPFLIPPILLGGDPGIGKTRFSQELADALGTVMRRLAFDNSQHGASLLGSDKHWANTTYGVVFELVVLGQVANPVVLLDEIDKASQRQEGHALASLHSLLEPVTSELVRDISVDFEFDASRVVWIATANELERIPAPLRSRFHEFWIEQPTGAQALQMAEVVAEEVHHLMDLPGFELPARQLVHYIAHLSAREQVQALKRAYAAAKVGGRHQVGLADLPEQVRRDASEFAGEDSPPTGLLH